MQYFGNNKKVLSRSTFHTHVMLRERARDPTDESRIKSINESPIMKQSRQSKARQNAGRQININVHTRKQQNEDDDDDN